ncbi:tetratricopeptide repeat protein [Chitinophaga vietnamensis]|uniref:tetratricopeptide repeat protein n=1 Tax=Chitinophaga vietnamensis TaxID=2593957 RepID=UPI001178B476|nr:tetratricopeptide repeat protein [Chitinophaga vietnamensis]
MNLEELERLYNEQEYNTAINELSPYLKNHPNDAPAWHLLGLCYMETAKTMETTEDTLATYENAYEAFGNALDNDPQHTPARLHRAFLGSNIFEDRPDSAIEDCELLLSSDDALTRAKGYIYRYHTWVLKKDSTRALEDIQQCLAIYETVYQDNLPQLNAARFECYSRIGDVWYYAEDKPKALDYYRQAFDCLPYNSRNIATARFALEMGDYELMERILHLESATESNYAYENVLTMLKQMQALLDSGVRNVMLARAFCWGIIDYISYFFGEDENEATLEQISLGKRCIADYPEEAYFYHFTGSAFYHIGSYKEALPYFEKANALGPYPSGVLRWYHAVYCTSGAFPPSWPDSRHPIPADWYTSGLTCSDTIDSTEDPEVRRALLPVKKYLYKRSFDLFYPYWHDNTGDSTAGHPHVFAMCCNNYGITLSELGEHEEAIRIHTIGYELSPFWEQLESRANAEHHTGRLEAAIADRSSILKDYTDFLPLMYYVSIHERIIEDLCTLQRYQEAYTLYNNILTEYDTWISKEMEEASEYERTTIIYNIDRIKTGRAFIKTDNENDLDQRIEALQRHLAEKPDDSDAYFNLMYLYFDAGQYEHCIGAINNRISIGGIEDIPLLSQMKIWYFRGKAELKLGRYADAVNDLQATLRLMEAEDDDKPTNHFSVYAFLSEAYLGLQDYLQCIDYGTRCASMYTDMNWAWDKEASGIHYILACAWEAQGNISNAKKHIDTILKNAPDYTPAVEKKETLKGGGLFAFLKRKK